METKLENFDIEDSIKFQELDCISLEDKAIDEKSNASDLHIKYGPDGDDSKIEINIFSGEEIDEKEDSRLKINTNISFSDEINEKSINNKFELNSDGFEITTSGLDITEIKGSCRKEFYDIVGENCLFDDDDLFLKSQNLLNNNIYKSLFGGSRHRKLNSGELHQQNVQDEQRQEKEFQAKFQINKQFKKHHREVNDHEEIQDEQFSQEPSDQLLQEKHRKENEQQLKTQREYDHREEMTKREQCVEEQLHQYKDGRRHQRELPFSEKKYPNERKDNFFYQEQTLFQVSAKKYLESQQRNEQFSEITSSLINTHDKRNADKYMSQLERKTEKSRQFLSKGKCRSTQGHFDEKYDKGNVAHTNNEKLEIHVTSLQKKYEALKRQLEYSRLYILKAEEERDEAQKALTMAKQEIAQMNEKYEYFNGTQNPKTKPIFVSSTASSSTSLNYKSDEWIAGNTNTEKLKNVVKTFANDKGQYVNSRNNSYVRRQKQYENQYTDSMETQDNCLFTNGHNQFNSYRKYYENPNQFASSSQDRQYYNPKNNMSDQKKFGHIQQQKKYKDIRDEIPYSDSRKSTRKQPDFSHNHFEYSDDQITDQNNSFQDKSRWMDVKNGKSYRKKLPFIIGMDPGKSTVNLQQTFATSKSYNTKSCFICKKNRIPENNKFSHNQEISGIDIALVRIISNITDELAHLKINLVNEYQAIDPVGNKARRVALIKEMKEVMDNMEMKGDQIATLHSVQKGYQTRSRYDNNVLGETRVQEKDA
ncbi:800_t:CDS:10 [Diversispora eburnea]|uniref:800_t:CDS:1 n=1 Tax=Diversispora eburnea TaxID=1213867 RepID=A0A9N8VKS4_9GLOM|nr:800_t:CDS:10 [Diversispora eburnea]